MKRIVIAAAGTVLGTAAVVIVLVLGWQQIQPQFKLPDDALNPFTITAPTANQAAIAKQQVEAESAALQKILDGFAGKYPGQFGIVVTDLKNGATARTGADEQMVAASLYKMYVAYGIFKKIDAGQLSLTSQTKGNALPVGECLRIMIVISDNDCGYALGTMVGWAALDADLAKLGLTKTKINNYVAPGSGNIDSDKLTSAADVALFTEALYQGKLLSATSTQKLWDIMKATELNTWLPSGLPKGAVIGHKTGALYNLVHDAGVVFAPKGDYLIVVMSRDWPNPVTQPPPAFADISRQVWDYFNG